MGKILEYIKALKFVKAIGNKQRKEKDPVKKHNWKIMKEEFSKLVDEL